MHKEKYQSLYETSISIPHNMGENILTILHVHGARAIFLLFCDHYYTWTESRELLIGVAGPVINHENIKGVMGQRYPYSTIREQNIVAILRIYGARSIILLFWDHQDTESELQEIEIGVTGPIFIHKNIKVSMKHRYLYPTIWEKIF